MSNGNGRTDGRTGSSLDLLCVLRLLVQTFLNCLVVSQCYYFGVLDLLFVHIFKIVCMGIGPPQAFT